MSYEAWRITYLSSEQAAREAYIGYQQQKHRADILAATIRELRDVVTHDAETKAELVARCRAILAADPDARLMPNAKFRGAAASSPRPLE